MNTIAKEVPVSIVAIAKNERENIERFISSVREAFKGHPAELVMVDTGSGDGTREIIKEKADVAGDFAWCSDFSEARNHSLSLARNDWVLVLDLDEFVTEVDWDGLQSFAHGSPKTVGRLRRRNKTLDENGTPSVYTDGVERFFNKTLYHYTGPIHEQVRPLETSGVEMTWGVIPVTVEHVGYAQSREKLREKAKRDLSLLLKELDRDPSDPYICFQAGQSESALGHKKEAVEFYERAINADPDPRLEYVQMLMVSYGYALTDLGRNEEALGLAGLYDDLGENADYVCLMGLIYLRNGMLADAVREYEKACGMGDGFSEGANTYIPRYNLGVIKEMSGDLKSAEELYLACGDYGPAVKRLGIIRSGDDRRS